MKKLLRLTVPAFLSVVLLAAPFQAAPAIAADHTVGVTVTDFELYNGTGDGVINDINPLLHDRLFGTKMTLEIDSQSGGFSAGDTATFPYLQITNPRITTVCITSGLTDIYGTVDGVPDTVIGQWRLNCGSPQQIEIIFADLPGITAIADVKLDTGLMNRLNQPVLNKHVEEEFKLGAVVKDYYVQSPTLEAVHPGRVSKSVRHVNDDTAQWQLTVNASATERLFSGDTTYDYGKSVYFEDDLQDGTFVGLDVAGLIHIPTELANPQTSTRNAHTPHMNSYFTQVTPDYTIYPTYAAFRASLAPYEWGVYANPDTGDNKIVIYFGDLDGSSGGISWAAASPNFATHATNQSISREAFDESDRAALMSFFTGAYGNSNPVGGIVSVFLLYLDVQYPAGKLYTTNTAFVECSGTVSSRSATATFAVLSGDGSAVSHEGKLIKTDMSGNALPGATIELQRSNGSGGWAACDATLCNTTVNPVVTGSGGVASFTGLFTGTYRFVETAAPAGYDKDSITFFEVDAVTARANSEFTITAGDTEGHVVLAKNDVLYAPVLEAVKTSEDASGNGVIEPGEEIIYRIAVTNTGNVAAVNAVVSDDLVDILAHIEDPTASLLTVSSNSFVSAGDTVGDLMTTGITIPRIDPNETLTVAFVVRVVADFDANAVTELVNIATIIPSEPELAKMYPMVSDPTGVTPSPDAPTGGSTSSSTAMVGMLMLLSAGFTVGTTAYRRNKSS